MMQKPKADIDSNEFPILKHGLYANHAAIAPWPRATAAAVADFAWENAEIGPEKYSRWLLRETQLRRSLARMLNAGNANDIALLKNTTEGICTVANGIDWQRGDNLVLPMDEFPSNRLPWLSLEQRGVEVREVDIRSSESPEQALLSRMDNNTRLLSVSAIQWTDGLRLDLQKLGSACRQDGVLFFVDAIQQLGAMQIDVKACNIDFLAADGHKWLLAPEGLAVFYCREGIREQLKLFQLGWHMTDEPYQFNRREWKPSKAAVRFEAGSPNTLTQAAMFASVELLLATGMKQVEALVTQNSAQLSESLANMPGVELTRPFTPERASGIVNFIPVGKDPSGYQKTLRDHGLICAVRGPGIRLSPHYYQAGKPVLEMLDVIERTILLSRVL